MKDDEKMDKVDVVFLLVIAIIITSAVIYVGTRLI